jgi:hypothetical protein
VPSAATLVAVVEGNPAVIGRPAADDRNGATSA